MTTSAPEGNTATRWAIRWRSRRRTRLRTTAPPTARDTANPTRARLDRLAGSVTVRGLVTVRTSADRATRRWPGPRRRASAKSVRRRSRESAGSTQISDPIGQAESLSRPLARRAPRIARPALVRMRSRKPCVLARRRLFGWNVRLLTRRLQANELAWLHSGSGVSGSGPSQRAGGAERSSLAAPTRCPRTARNVPRYGPPVSRVKLTRPTRSRPTARVPGRDATSVARERGLTSPTRRDPRGLGAGEATDCGQRLVADLPGCVASRPAGPSSIGTARSRDSIGIGVHRGRSVRAPRPFCPQAVDNGVEIGR